MTPDDFQSWLTLMRVLGLASSDAACARLLGITPMNLRKMKIGTIKINQRTALACEALLHRLDPFEKKW